MNFQTLVCDLTAMDISNASLLDESTAAAEAMAMAHAIKGGSAFFVADDCHPQTIAVLRTRANPLGIRLIIGPVWDFTSESGLRGSDSISGDRRSNPRSRSDHRATCTPRAPWPSWPPNCWR